MKKGKATHVQNTACPWPKSKCGVPYGGLTKKGELRPFPTFSDDPTCQVCIYIEKAARKRAEQ